MGHSWTLYLLLSLVGISSLQAGVNAECRLRLEIDPSSSSFTLGGVGQLTVGTTVIPAPISPKGAYKTAFVGAFYANVTGDTPCPVTYAVCPKRAYMHA